MSLKSKTTSLFAAIVTVAALTAGPANASVLFQSDAANGQSSRSAFSGILTRFTTTGTVQLTNIAVSTDLASAGNLAYYVFNSLTGALLFNTATKAFADDGQTFKVSDAFAFELEVGTTYAIGAFADVASVQAYVVPGGKTMNGITSLGGNQNFSGTFATPVFGGGLAGTDAQIQLIGTIGNQVPEPSSLALIGLAIAAAGVAARRKQAA